VNRADLTLISATRAALRDGSAKAARERAGVTQKEMAAVLGVARSAVSQWEAGKRVPGTALTVAYGRALAALTPKAA
jgi:DNA-binding XRE family transcriptional regulator